MNIHYLQHVPFEGPASIESWALQNGHSLSATRLYAGDPLPALDRFELLLVLGGPMSVHDDYEHVWLKAEKWFIRQVIDSGKPILGVCLGAQLLAQALGAEVLPAAHKEIGWHPVRLNHAFLATSVGAGLPETTEAFHWHGETFTLPEGAVAVGSSEACATQGFLYRERILALQFHLETTPLAADMLVENCREELLSGAYIQSESTILAANDKFMNINEIMTTIMDSLSAVAATS